MDVRAPHRRYLSDIFLGLTLKKIVTRRVFYYFVPFPQILPTHCRAAQNPRHELDIKQYRCASIEDGDAVCFFIAIKKYNFFPLNKPRSMFSGLFPAPTPAADLKTDF